MNAVQQREITLPKRFDFNTHAAFTSFRDEALTELGSPIELILDFSQVKYIDTAALGIMVLMKRKSAPLNNVQVYVRNAQGHVKDFLEMANINKMFGIQN